MRERVDRLTEEATKRTKFTTKERRQRRHLAGCGTRALLARRPVGPAVRGVEREEHKHGCNSEVLAFLTLRPAQPRVARRQQLCIGTLVKSSFVSVVFVPSFVNFVRSVPSSITISPPPEERR
jgi:hypothetical protein